jgi:hypothetical protein
MRAKGKPRQGSFGLRCLLQSPAPVSALVGVQEAPFRPQRAA